MILLGQMSQALSKTLTFRISCWLMGLVAFAQLIISGVTLAIRFEQTRQVKVVEKIVTQEVTVPAVKTNVYVPPVTADIKEPEAPTVAKNILPAPRPLTNPSISDPVCERLVNEARSARFSEDMMSAITKLEQAKSINPNEPNTLFEIGLVHESMGIYDRAASYFHQVFAMGTSGAGTLYQQAAMKLRDGFEQPQDKINRIVLGRARVFTDPDNSKGQRVVLTIPVQSIPGEVIESRDLEVTVNFFDEVGAKKEIAAAATEVCKIDYRWVTEPTDWQGGEELLRVSYTIPSQDLQQEHLFGERKYYGQVVELSYKGELIDAQAWPRILAHKLNKPEQSPMFLEQELPPDFNRENPLLPNVSAQQNDEQPLPTFDNPPPLDDNEADYLPPPPSDLPPDGESPLPVPAEYKNLPSR